MIYPKLKVKDLIEKLGGADEVYFSLKANDKDFKYTRIDAWLKRNTLPTKFLILFLLQNKIKLEDFVSYDNQTEKQKERI